MSNQLTKADAARKRSLGKPGSLIEALQNGGPLVWASCLVMGLGNIAAGQFIKGILFLLFEIGIIVFMVLPGGGIYNLSMLPSLGWLEQEEVWDDAQGIFVYTEGHRSQLILLYGVATVAILILAVVIWRASVRSGYLWLSKKKAGKKVNSFIEDVKALFDENIHKLLMLLPFTGILVFTIVPLIYMISMAFTNYSAASGAENHAVLFDWVGLETFEKLFSSSGFGDLFWGVLGWTLIWAFFATFLNFFLGTFVAMIINRPTTKLKGLWRTIFSLTVAIPQFVSLLLINTMFRDQGILNSTLKEFGFISESLPFLTNATWARCLVIIINLWVGIPYTIMQVTGILKNIPAEQYEAAKIDGANVFQTFANITIPYMIFVMTPYLITQFTGNINNFNVIYLLTGGAPTAVGNTAGSTDLLVTWLYKLSVDKQQYNLAAVIGIFTFVVLSIVSLVTYRSSGSYKDEEGFK